jgi:hypothetical protein
MYNLIFEESNGFFSLIVLSGDEPILTSKFYITQFINNFDIKKFDLFINSLEMGLNYKYNLSLDLIIENNTERFSITSSDLSFNIILSDRARIQFVKEFKKMFKYILNWATEHEFELFDSYKQEENVYS